MFRLVVVTGLVALVACGGETRRVHRPGEEYLTAIRIEGNHAIQSEDLIPGLALNRNAEGQRAVDDYQLQVDTSRIAAAYQKLGYFAVDVKSRVDKHGDAATVVFTVVEAARAKTRVEITGLPADIPYATARALVGLADGAPFDYARFDDAKAPLLLLVQDAGYAHARIDNRVLADRAHAQATVRFTVDPGPPCTFGDVQIIGADGMLADAIRARLGFTPGAPYSTSAIIRTQLAIYGTSLFSTARVEPNRSGDARTVPVKISVTLHDRNELTLAVGAAIDPLTYSFRSRLQYLRRGFLTPLTTLALEARPEYALESANCGFDLWNCDRDLRLRALATLTQQDLLLPNVKGDVEGGADYVTVEAYTRAGGHARLGLATPLGTPKLMLRVGWQLAYVSFVDVFVDDATSDRLGLASADYIGAYTAALALDLRDQPIAPRRGLYAEMRAAIGTRLAGGQFDYLQMTPQLRAFWPIGRVVIAARARLGVITGDVPVTERYFGGGMSSQRGFGQRGLSPVAHSREAPLHHLPIGGTALIETSFELRGPLGELWGLDLGGVAFIDGGDVTKTIDALDPWSQHIAAGFGVRVLTPIGPIGVDLAYRINRTAPGASFTDHLNLLFAVGEAF